MIGRVDITDIAGPDSPARKLGFQPIGATQIGPRKK